MEAIDFIRKKVSDVLLAKLDFDVVLSKRQVIEKIAALEPTFGGMAVHYDHSGRRVEIVWSHALQQKWEGKLQKGQKIRCGNRKGVLAEDGVYWVGTDRCLYVDFGNGGEAYDITNVEPDTE